jgi:hypothetical protein
VRGDVQFPARFQVPLQLRATRLPNASNRQSGLGLIDICPRPPEPLALRTGIAQAGLDPLLDQCVLKLRDSADNLKHKPAGWWHLVNALAELEALGVAFVSLRAT